MNLKFFAIVAISFASYSISETANADDRLNLRIDGKSVKTVSPVKYGLHYEEIGMMGEGALHAELIRNRSFEEATPAKDMSVRNGLYEDIPNPSARGLKEVVIVDPMIGWETLPLSYSPIFISRTNRNRLNVHNEWSMLVNVTEDIAERPNSIILNKGYFGMNLKIGTNYNLSFFAKSNSFSGKIKVFLVDENGKQIGDAETIAISDKKWQKFTSTLTVRNASKRGMLAIQPLNAGNFQMDVISLMPSDTFNGGKSVFRADIVENIKHYSPSFIRFPGGCIVHGINAATMYKWKETIGPAENRRGEWSKWAPFYRTDGIGYHEFYELCEYTGADAMYVIPTGMVCPGWTKQPTKNDNGNDENIAYYINDALDAIEYAIGDTNTPWGAKRAENGHPEKFPLKYIQIGNEDFGPEYWHRYEIFYKALAEKYPDLIYITDSAIGKDNGKKRDDISRFPNPENVKVFDEHYYQDVEWACNQHYKFDGYERGIADLYIAELGLNGKYPLDILATAAVRMALERNGDLNPMLAERPVMRNWDFIEHTYIQPMLLNTAEGSFKMPLYFIADMFRKNTIDKFISSEIECGQNERKVFATLGFDSTSGDFILKLLNIDSKTVTLTPKVKNMSKAHSAVITSLTLTDKVTNTPGTKETITPIKADFTLSFNKPIEMLPYTLSVIRFK